MPTWILFWSSAATVSGPLTSRGLNDLKFNPYVCLSPIRQYGRVGHSGGPPSTSFDATLAEEPDGAVVPPLPPLLPELPQAASTKAMHAVKASATRARGEVRTGKSFRRFSAGVYQEVGAASRRDTER